MIDPLASAWQLFAPGFCSGIVTAALCGVVGIHVVLRRTVFLVLALAQMASLGVALSLLARGWMPGHGDPHLPHPWFHCLADPALMSFATVLLGMALVWGMRGLGGLPSEAWLGGLTALASALSVLAVARSAYGLDEVKHLLFADFLLVQADGFRALLLLALAAGGVLILFRRHFLLAGFDPDQSRAMGISPGSCLLGLDLLPALVIAFTIRAGGSLVVFGLLILPPLAVIASARRVKGLWLWSPLLGVLGTLAGLFGSLQLDLPAGPSVIAAVAAAGLTFALARRAARAP